MRPTQVVLAFAAVLLVSDACAQSGRTVTGAGQTKPPSRDAAPPATGGSDEQKQTELSEAIRRGQERQQARDRATDELFERWQFAVCVGCNVVNKPFRRVWTNPLRVLAGIPASEDDKRQARPSARWASLVTR